MVEKYGKSGHRIRRLVRAARLGLPVCDRCEVRPVEQETVCFEAKERFKAGGGKSWVIRQLLEHHLRWNGDPPTHQCPAGLSRNRYGATSRLQMLQPLQVYQMGVVLDGVQPEHPSTSRRPHRLGGDHCQGQESEPVPCASGGPAALRCPPGGGRARFFENFDLVCGVFVGRPRKGDFINCCKSLGYRA